MMSKSGTMLSLMAFTVAMLVQNTFQLPTPTELVEFPESLEIPEDLTTEWDKLEDPAEEKKLQDLALLELKRVREGNGVNGNLTPKEEIYKVLHEQAKFVCNEKVRLGANFSIEAVQSKNRFFNQIIGVASVVENEEREQPITPGHVVLGSMERWYEVWREDVQSGKMKDVSGTTLNPDIKYYGVAVSRTPVVKDENGENVTYYSIVLDMGTEQQFVEFNNKEKPTP